MASERVRRRIDRLLDEAEAAADAGDWGRLRERAEMVLAVDPQNADAAAFIAMADKSRKTGQRASAAQEAPNAREPSTAATELKPVRPAESIAGSVTSTHPTSFANGRYVVKKLLGEGGKKRVYLAHDTTLDRDVAFALIKSESLDEAARRRILREAQAMGRLGDHPNIVPIHDLGTEGLQPFMVLPLMQGGDVAELIEKAKDHRPPLDQVLGAAKDVCEGLAFAHSKGIVHRDLKPGNVWLTDRGQAKIGDFGLALPLEQSRLTREGFMVGTVAYMPPEQAMGGEITPRADLYSLGAMLYEMVTGRPPFLGDDDIAIIGQHINTPPVAPGWHNPRCPKPLEALIIRLLAKDPAQRPESAKDVIAALEAVNTTGATTSALTAKGGEEEQSRSLDSMSSGVFVGRHKEMDQLRAALEEPLSGYGRMVVLVGEPGIGKTRTAQELATYAGLRRCQVLWGRCYEGSGAPPYWPWVQAIRQYVQEHDPDQLRREMGSSASVIAEVVHDVKGKFPEIQPPPQIENPESARFRLFDAIASFLKSASRTQAMVVVLDDLHWADKPTLLLVEFVARELTHSRILLVGTYRDVELNRRHPLAITLGDLTKERLFERVILRGLQKQDVKKFIELSAGVIPPPMLVDAVFTQTEGNPLFVTEVVRLLIQEGHLSREVLAQEKSKKTTWLVRVPEGVKEVIGRRLDRISERSNALLTNAAVLGRQFTLAQLLAVHQGQEAPPEERLAEGAILDSIDEGLAARIVEELPNKIGGYQFTHALMQETLLSELPITRRVRLHARIARALEQLYAGRAADHAEELVPHFAAAETVLGKESLVKYLIAAGERANETHAYEEAARYFLSALAACGGRVTDRISAVSAYGLARARLATVERREMQAAVDLLDEAFKYFESTGDTELALRVAMTPVINFGNLTGVAALYKRGIGLARPASPEAALLSARFGLFHSMETGNWDESDTACQHAIQIADTLDAPALQASVLILGGMVAGRQFRFDVAKHRLARALGLGVDRMDPQLEFSAHEHSGLMAMKSGDPATAESHFAKSLASAEKANSPAMLRWAIGNLMSLAGARGDWAELARYSAMPSANTDEVRVLGPQFRAAVLQGDWQRADALFARLDVPEDWNRPLGRQNLPLLEGLTLRAWTSGDEILIEDAYARSKFALAKGGIERWHELNYKVHAALGAVLAGVTESASELYEETKRLDGLTLFFGGASMSRVLGFIAWKLGLISDALGHYQRAIEFNRTSCYRPDLAWTLFEYSGLPSAAGDHDQEALQLARDLGMKPLIERIIGRKKILKA